MGWPLKPEGLRIHASQSLQLFSHHDLVTSRLPYSAESFTRGLFIFVNFMEQTVSLNEVTFSGGFDSGC
jgi:hypothetical protein